MHHEEPEPKAKKGPSDKKAAGGRKTKAKTAGGVDANASKKHLLDVAKNRYALNGHVYQREGLTAYLPANGGLLAAVAMMAAGWTGAPDRHAPGFPGDGAWTVRWEGLNEWL